MSKITNQEIVEVPRQLRHTVLVQREKYFYSIEMLCIVLYIHVNALCHTSNYISCDIIVVPCTLFIT